MATTTKGFRYPVGTDPNNVPLDIQHLAEDVDAMPGIAMLTTTQRNALSAGQKWTGREIWNLTTGRPQYWDGAAWQDGLIATDSPVKASHFSAKGDLIVGTASSAFARLAVGANGTIPIADSSQAGGLRYGTPFVGDLLDAKFARKTADESVNNSAALQNDDHLARALAANEIWTFEAVLFVLGPGGADLKAAFTVPAGATLLWEGPGPDTPLTDGQAAGTSYWNSASGSGTALSFATSTGVTLGYRLRGIVLNGANASTLQFQWAQVAATVGNTTLKAGSHMISQRWA